jgi:hypothetical protein
MRTETTLASPVAADSFGRDVSSGTEAPAALPSVSLLALQFLAWLAARPRSRADVMDAWRSTCPRQSVWEDTVIDGLVRIDADTAAVVLTPLGRAVLAQAEAADAKRG